MRQTKWQTAVQPYRVDVLLSRGTGAVLGCVVTRRNSSKEQEDGEGHEHSTHGVKGGTATKINSTVIMVLAKMSNGDL